SPEKTAARVRISRRFDRRHLQQPPCFFSSISSSVDSGGDLLALREDRAEFTLSEGLADIDEEKE
ncbi:hypothetical protein PMAYCL1PPCAC_02760, partial [Pristionchus mayeri]